jgi:hypothetical protein
MACKPPSTSPSMTVPGTKYTCRTDPVLGVWEAEPPKVRRGVIGGNSSPKKTTGLNIEGTGPTVYGRSDKFATETLEARPGDPGPGTRNNIRQPEMHVVVWAAL